MGVFSIQTLASGYALNESSANGLGRAYAGDAAVADNASSQWVNPALLTYLYGTQVSIGMVYAKPDIWVKGSLGKAWYHRQAVLADSSGNIAQDAYTPNLSISHQCNDQFFMGLAIGSDFGARTDFGENFAASHFGHYINIETEKVNLNMAYKVSPMLSLGGGLGYVKGSVSFREKSPVIGLARAIPLANIDGSGGAWGWQFGALSQLTPTTRFGISYRSEVMLKLKAEANGVLFGGLYHGNTKYQGRLNLVLPAMVDVSLSQQVSERVTLLASVNWTQWSRFKGLLAKMDTIGQRSVKRQNWHDSYQFALGGLYQVSDEWRLRSGVAWEQSVVSSYHRALVMPDAERTWLTFGAGYQVTSNVSIDAGLAYIMGKKASIAEPTDLADQEQAAFYGAFTGYSKTTAWLVGIQSSYTF